MLSAAASELGVMAAAGGSVDGETRHKVGPVRVGLFDVYGGNMPTGWDQWLLEQFEFPVQLVWGDRVHQGDLRRDFDVLIFHTGLPGPRNLQRAARQRKPKRAAVELAVVCERSRALQDARTAADDLEKRMLAPPPGTCERRVRIWRDGCEGADRVTQDARWPERVGRVWGRGVVGSPARAVTTLPSVVEGILCSPLCSVIAAPLARVAAALPPVAGWEGLSPHLGPAPCNLRLDFKTCNWARSLSAIPEPRETAEGAGRGARGAGDKARWMQGSRPFLT